MDPVISGALRAWFAITDRYHLYTGRISLEDHYILKNSNPFITIYVPTHNRADLLMERSLPSILNQTYTNFQVFVIAHGCTDDTVERVLELEDTRVSIIELERRQTYPPTLENHWCAGRGAASNEGLNWMWGDWIATNDDDDIWAPDHLESLIDMAIEFDLEFISAGTKTPDGAIEPYSVDGMFVGSLQTWLYRSYLGNLRFNTQCWRKKWNRVLDTDLQQRLRSAGVRMGYLDKCLAEIMPKADNQKIGLSGAREDEEAYMGHLTFTKE